MRLVEVGNHGFYDSIFVSRSNDDLRAGMQRFHVMPVEVGYNCLQSIYSGCCCCFKRRFIRLPLFYMQIFFRSVRIVQQSNAYGIEAFQRTYRGCPYRNGFSFLRYQLFVCISCPSISSLLTGLNVPAPTCRVSSSNATPFSRKASKTRGVKCRPAVGAATEPFILE